MKKTKLFVVNAIIITATALVIKTVASAFEIYISNKVGAEAIGVYQLVMSIYFFAITLATSGVNLATTIIVAEKIEKSECCNLKTIVKKCLIYSLSFGMLSCTLLLMFSSYITTNWLQAKISPLTLQLLALSLPFISMTSCLAGYFSAVRKVARTSIAQILSQAVRIIIVTFALTLVFPSGIEYACLSLVIGGTVAEITSFIFTYFVYIKDIQRKTNRSIVADDTNKRIFSIALPIAFTSYIRSGLSTIKQMLIPLRLKKSGMSYEKALANYGIVTGMALPILFFPSVVVFSYSSLLIPEFSGYNATKDTKSILKDISKMLKITLYYSICITGILFTFGNDLGNLLYNNTAVGWYIQMLSPLVVLIYLDNVIDSILKGLGKQVSVMCCNILDLIVSVSFIYFLLPVFSVYGYIIVMYISEILNYTISVITLFKTTNFKFRYLDWVIIPLICVFFAKIVVSILPLNNLVVTITLFVVIYTTALITTENIKNKSLNTLK